MMKRLFNLRSDREHFDAHEHAPHHIPNRETFRNIGSRIEERFTNEQILGLGISAVGATTVLTAQVIDTVVNNESVTGWMTVYGACGVAVGGLTLALERITRH